MENNEMIKKTINTLIGGKAISGLLSNPSVLNFATRSASSLSNRFGSLILARYPKLVTMATQGLDMLEAKLKEYNTQNSSQNSEETTPVAPRSTNTTQTTV